MTVLPSIMTIRGLPLSFRAFRALELYSIVEYPRSVPALNPAGAATMHGPDTASLGDPIYFRATNLKRHVSFFLSHFYLLPVDSHCLC